MFRSNYKILIAVFPIAFLIFSCSDSGKDCCDQPIAAPENLQVIADIAGKDGDHPYGDGSGVVNFTVTVDNATSIKVLIENKVAEYTIKTFSYRFTVEGIQEYEVVVSAYNGSEFITETLKISVWVGEESEPESGLVWFDEFNDGKLDTDKWNYETGTGVDGYWGTGQLDRATDREDNVSFQEGIAGADGGCLVITTRKEDYLNRNYTSGRINTADKAFWGPGHRIEARVYPKDVRYQGQGFAFWMMPQEIPEGYDHLMWPQGGEIDIMEYVGSIPYNNLATVHYAWEWNNNEYANWNHGHLGAYFNYETKEVPEPAEPGYGNFPPPVENEYAGSSDFHIYGIDWYNDRIEFYIDDYVYHIHYLNDGGAFSADGQDEIEIKTIEGRRVGVSEYSNHFNQWKPFENKMYAILSAGVGGQDYTYGGPVVEDAVFPCSVYIDWIRVYRH